MKIQLLAVLGVLMAASGFLLNAAELSKESPALVKKAAVTPFVYVCPDCPKMAMCAGKCEKCGKELVQKHLLGTKDGQAMLCDCSVDCKCDAKGVQYGKCACGRVVQMRSCKGMYCCSMGCPKVSDKPGKCVCGEEMKKVEELKEMQ